MNFVRQSVRSLSSFLGSSKGRVAVLVACGGVWAMLSANASAAIIGPVASFPVSDPTSAVDSTVPGISYNLLPGTALIPNGFDVRDLFGGSFGTNGWEQNDVLFADGALKGTVSAVSINLTTPIALTNFHLFLEDDGTNGNRSANEFMLYSGTTLVDDIHILDTTGSQSYTSVYGSNYIEISDTLPNLPLSGNYTLAFVQNQDSGSSSGVRASEFTASGTLFSTVPEPASFSMVVIGSIGVLGRRRRTVNA
jgi:hypothetical protein